MLRYSIAAIALLAATPAMAQDAADPLPDPNDRSDTVTVGLGAGYVPDYEGSDDYRIIPAAAVRGRVGGISFFTRATYLYVDFIGRGDGPVELDVGPIAGVRLNRTGKIKDDFVDDLPELDTAVEVGGFLGATYHGLTNPYDSLSFRVDVVKDVGGAHKSTLVTPTIDFGTPLSRSFYVGVSASAEWAGGGYADYYYSIDAADALASGLPAYDADGGFKSWRLGLLGNYALSGDLTNGWSVFALGSYSKLAGDFKDSPIVDLRGSSTQWFGALGVAYTF
ncbi:MAG TPA: MipA/OmpV family protein [Sphingomicrobium sp.]|jgi:outer membrane scaffolding protein for murein synthesis (MipA/OmpV family)|nr:MipA/OmpV family protein [Sphingomicrobium sp.]